MRNVGTPDRIIRLIVGAGLIALPFLAALPAWGLWASVVVGAVLIATAVFSFCPIYAALGINSRPKTQSD